MKFGIFTIIFFLSTICVFSSDLKFYSISDLYGISVKEAYSICKDGKGFVWGASKTGIIRFSEIDYRIYNLPYKTTDVFLTKLIYDNSLLIAYTNNGQIFTYNPLYDRFTFFVDLREILDYHHLVVQGIVLDKDRNLWIGTSVGLFKYENSKLIPVPEINVGVQHIAACGDSCLFYATVDGFGVLDMATCITDSLYRYTYKDELLISSFLYNEDAGCFLIGTITSGLLRYDLKQRIIAAIPVGDFPKQPVLVLKENTDTTFLAGVDGQGIWELTFDGKVILNVYKEDVNDPYTLHGNGVYDILNDQDGRVWVATFTGGFSFFERKQPFVNQITHHINRSNSLVNNYVNQLLEDRNGNLWFATNNGISYWDIPADRWTPFFQDRQDGTSVFLALCEDDEGNIWAGTYSSGVYVLDKRTGKVLEHYFHEKDGCDFSVRFVRDIYKDSQGNIWIGGTNNVICYLKEEKHFRVYDPQPVNSVEELSSGRMLLACSNGLLSLDKNTGEYEYLLENCFVQDVVYIDGELWAGTSGEGLVRYDCKSRAIKKYTTESGLSSNYINSVIYEGGHLWIGTEEGLCRLAIKDKQVCSNLPALPFMSFSFNVGSCIRLKNGHLAWGTNKGAIVFNPDLLYQEESRGEIFFQDIHISGSSIRENEYLLKKTLVNQQTKLLLNYNQNNFGLEVLPLGMYTAGSKFSWRMEGVDDEWNMPSGYRFITYINLPSGVFELKIRMHDSSLSTLLDERSLIVEIIPPFWKTWWFRLVVATLFLCLLLYLLKTYSNHLKQRHTRDKIRFFTNMAHDIRTSLTLINAPIEELNNAPELSERSRYYLDLAREQSGKLSLTSNQLLDFQKIDMGHERLFLTGIDIVKLVGQRVQMFTSSARRKNIRLLFSPDKDAYITAVDELKIEKVVDNLLSNAIKYSNPDSDVEVRLVCNVREWSLEVKDYGIGIPGGEKGKLFREFYRGENAANSKIVGSGIGLLLVRDYVMMHKGRVFIDSKENEGSSFKIVIPYEEVNNVFTDTKTEYPIEEQEKFHAGEPIAVQDRVENDRKPFLLVVEDHEHLCEFLHISLGGSYEVLTANNGLEAWNIINKKAPDLVISDVMMPEMDGFRLCQLMKSTFETSHIPIILLTALTEKAKQLEGLGWGGDDYITKPFDMILLKQRIRSIIRNREIVREKMLRLIKQTNRGQSILKNELNDQFVKKALGVVHENMSDAGFGKDEFASAMNVSPSLLYQKMKALAGQSPTDFIRIIRFNYALELLQSRKYTITEISEMCGFSSASYFSTAFRKHFGKSPVEILNEQM